MRHNKKFNHLGRTSSHRKAMLSNMASSLILHKRINTTVAKAKALKMYIEPLVTKAKDDTTHSRRIVFSYLENKEAVAELFRDVVVKVGDRPGGYTRILRTETRLGDNADMCMIEFVDYNEAMLEAKDSKKKASRRSRVKSKTATTVTETVKAEKSSKAVAVAEKEPVAVVNTPAEEVVDNIVEEAPEVKAESTEISAVDEKPLDEDISEDKK
ncbi:MAG: 50S ribosomal protein L17 [Bacteroidales bacterium]|nr:50S ribosomal protein L17 [Bacteroidales bacterium]